MLDQNAADLRPRAHLYLTAGARVLPLAFTLDTTAFSDGYHELTAVAYEGSHNRAQTRAAQFFRFQNTPLSASFDIASGSTNNGLNEPLIFSISANTANISKIELFSTGGSVGSVAGQATVNISVPALSLGLGLHPFYAIVTANNNTQYRTETKWVRLLDDTSVGTPFVLSIANPPPKLSWPALIGHSYEILATTNFALPFQRLALVVATNSLGTWTDTEAASLQRFYRVHDTN
jgi:hypothetical protein